MRKYIFLCLLSCVCIHYLSSAYILDKGVQEQNMYEITKIKNKKTFYIIYAERNDSIFKIITEKKMHNTSKCFKIKKGKRYNLNLEIIFPVDHYPLLKTKGPINFLDITYTYNKKPVALEKKCHYKIYRANNLNGLCIQE